MDNTTLASNLKKSDEIHITILKQIPNILIGSIALLVTLNWNRTIAILFDRYIPKNLFGLDPVWSQVLDSLILTVIAIGLIYIIIKTSSSLQNYF